MRLEGLTHCQQLEELYLSHQNIHHFQYFSLDAYSLAVLSVLKYSVLFQFFLAFIEKTRIGV